MDYMLLSYIHPFMPQGVTMDDLLVGFHGGLQSANITIVCTVLLELISLDTVFAVWKKGDGKSLYASAVFLNFFNHYFLGIPIYIGAYLLFVRRGPVDDTPLEVAASVAGILLIHSFWYYYAHMAMHTPSLYRFHRYHHRFNTHVVPSAANAVTLVEYVVAYIIPFAAAAAMIRPTEPAVRWSVLLVSIPNLFIHTPAFEKVYAMLPPYLVSTQGHHEHHQRLTVNYSAPTVNLDWVLGKLGMA